MGLEDLVSVAMRSLALGVGTSLVMKSAVAVAAARRLDAAPDWRARLGQALAGELLLTVLAVTLVIGLFFVVPSASYLVPPLCIGGLYVVVLGKLNRLVTPARNTAYALAMVGVTIFAGAFWALERFT